MADLISRTGTCCLKATNNVSRNWNTICEHHIEQFPQIHDCWPGTFNVILDEDYVPPQDEDYRHRIQRRVGGHGNHISPCAKVVALNGEPVQAWLYRGGHFNNTLELLATEKLSEKLQLSNGDRVTIEIKEVAEGTPGMPVPPAL